MKSKVKAREFRIEQGKKGLPISTLTELDSLQDKYETALSDQAEQYREEVVKVIDEYLLELSPKNKRNDFEKGVAFGMRYINVQLKSIFKGAGV